MNIMVVNCGSSSQSIEVFQVTGEARPRVIAAFRAKNVATIAKAPSQIEIKHLDKKDKISLKINTHREAASQIIKIIQQMGLSIDWIGHRYVHGGDLFSETTLINKESLEKLRSCFSLAPIHNPNSFSVIETCLEELPGIPQVVVFDTAFHAGLPDSTRRYALPADLTDSFGYHKVGFHGLSLQSVTTLAAKLLDKPRNQMKLIICHLGTGGSSVTAFAQGHSVDTSMGFSPLAGLVMSTRSGDVDPGILIDLMRRNYSADEIESLLNQQSGLIGLTGYSSNLEEVITRAETGDEPCRIAFEVYANRVRHYIGAYLFVLNGADAIVFTDGIGVSSWKLREKVLEGANNLGVLLDCEANKQADPASINQVHAKNSKIQILIIPNDEEGVICDEVLKISGVD